MKEHTIKQELMYNLFPVTHPVVFFHKILSTETLQKLQAIGLKQREEHFSQILGLLIP